MLVSHAYLWSLSCVLKEERVTPYELQLWLSCVDGSRSVRDACVILLVNACLFACCSCVLCIFDRRCHSLLMLSTTIDNRALIDLLDHFSINAQTQLHNSTVLNPCPRLKRTCSSTAPSTRCRQDSSSPYYVMDNHKEEMWDITRVTSSNHNRSDKADINNLVLASYCAVSYTHLTLPTILLV